MGTSVDGGPEEEKEETSGVGDTSPALMVYELARVHPKSAVHTLRPILCTYD